MLVAFATITFDAVRPYFSKIKHIFLSNAIIRNIFVTIYALSQY